MQYHKHNETPHPILREPPLAHALHRWDPLAGVLTYEYNGRVLLHITLPVSDEPGYRHGSDGNLQSMPFVQQVYLMLDDLALKPVRAQVRVTLSGDAVCMRARRAGSEEAIIGQVGRPLLHGVNGLYDISQDLLIDWHGASWQWTDKELRENGQGVLIADFAVEIGHKPWFINIRPHYYREHLGYHTHTPWERRPDTRSINGWCSWEAYRRAVTLDNVKEAASFFEHTLKPYGLEYIQLDDGFEQLPIPFDPAGTVAKGWLETNERFPGGHDEVVRTIRSTGMIPAIWTNANVTSEPFAQRNAHSLILDRDGTPVIGEWIDYLLDCSAETLAKHVAPYYRGLKEKGYEYFKTDAIRHLLFDGLQEAVRRGLLTNHDARARFHAFMLCARDAIGQDAYLLASWGELTEAIGAADACRIAMDANPTWAGVRMQIVESARWFHSQRILFVNDPDHICARAQLEWTRSVCSLVCLSGGLFMLSDPLADYDEQRLRIISRCIPALTTMTAETGPLPLDMPAFTWTKLHGFAVNAGGPVEAQSVSMQEALNMAGEYPTMNDCSPFATLWSVHITRPWGSWAVVARFATVPLSAGSISLENCGLDPKKSYVAFDFWKQRSLGIVQGRVAMEALELGHCQLIALHPVSDTPHCIGSSRHVSMDAVSIRAQRWEAPELVLEIDGVAGTTEDYWFSIPGNYELSGCLAEGALLKWDQNDTLAKVSITFQNRQPLVRLQFKLTNA